MGSSSLTRNQTQNPCIKSSESYPLDYQGSPSRWTSALSLSPQGSPGISWMMADYQNLTQWVVPTVAAEVELVSNLNQNRSTQPLVLGLWLSIWQWVLLNLLRRDSRKQQHYIKRTEVQVHCFTPGAHSFSFTPGAHSFSFTPGAHSFSFTPGAHSFSCSLSSWRSPERHAVYRASGIMLTGRANRKQAGIWRLE